jgi:hypothetical protein
VRISIVEVWVRSPEVFVRPLAHQEALRLKRIAKRSVRSSTRQRAAILLGSNARLSATQIAASWLTDESHVRKVIHDFNERGSTRWTLSIGAGVPAGSRVISASGSSAWPVPAPTARVCR